MTYHQRFPAIGRASRKRAERFRLALLAATAAGFMMGAGAAVAQETVRIRGTIERAEGGKYVVKTRQGDLLDLSLRADASVASSVKSSLSDIRTGLYIGVAAVPREDGGLRAIEAHIFDESMRGTAEGHRAWDLLPQSTMTNAVVVEIVSALDGDTIVLRYKDGEQRIDIPAAIAVVTYLPGSVAELKPGAVVFVPAAVRQPDGLLIASRVMVGRDAPPPQ